MVTKGPGYFVYRKKLKLQKDKICVSIIMPVYNAERFLTETLDSLLNQNLPNIEIICVDDGSMDGSLELLNQYKEKDSRIIIMTQENQGAGAARNKGLEMAKGEYLLFLDADDIFHESMCNQAYYQCIKKKADICLFGARRMNMETLETEPMDWVLQRRLLPSRKVFSADDVSGKLFQLTTGCPWNKMFRREFVLQTDIRFQNLQNANDAYFVRMHMALAERITVLHDRFVTYRFNTGSNIQANKAKAPFAFYEAFRAIKEELEKRGLFTRFERTFCNMALKESLFNMRTTGDDDMKQVIKERLQREILPCFGVMEHGEDFYYNKNEYQEMKELG
jgi:glycosyltransferase involved in cell wall biosynthesis